MSQHISDIDIMVLLDIMPIVKSEDHFNKWIENYPFYANIEKERVTLYAVRWSNFGA